MVILFHIGSDVFSQRADMIHYRLFPERLCGEELGEYETYGIIAANDAGGLKIIHDVSCDRERAEALTALFNAEELDPIHLDEAIESFLYTFEV